jgi:hypothetical protein
MQLNWKGSALTEEGGDAGTIKEPWEDQGVETRPDPRINEYIVNFSEFRRANGMAG